MSAITWAFAVEPFAGDLHIVPHEMPPAENLVNVRLRDTGGVYVINAADAVALRALLGTPSIKEVVRHVGPDVAGELEDLLAGITALIDKRVARLRGDGPDDEGPGGLKS